MVFVKKLLGEAAYTVVCDSLREDILNGALKPGERLKIAELVKRFDISPMPIREALQRLEGEGLIIINPHRGACVRQLNKKYISNMHEIRIAIECMLVHKACRFITVEALDKLNDIQRMYDLAMENPNPSELVQINTQFHFEIFSYSDNEEAVKILYAQVSAIKALRLALGFHPRRPPQIISKEHHQIIEAFRSGDPDHIERVYRNHCENSMNELNYFFELLDDRKEGNERK